MDKKQIYIKAIDKWGFKSQSIMLMEECAELIQAVSKLHRTGNPNKMYEEIADVEIMIEQIKTFYGDVAEKETDKHYKNKLDRLEGLIQNAGGSKKDM
ncbi:hypothetical protein DFR79_13230 [Halanaerobium saccharolyticum]|jgi:NTP pyrophosphatase (non-canonical NTP hydrolase)|uniref:MazG-like nucleotide pyrophosphohydrolase family protein n=1 Tax=Halanaerobium saccharolyticum TaxID=43595 RepID=A0A4R6LG27_9FIRM|nr:hypothetical protein [Halanaerobium saccharolyticum]TDO77698.1 hypothetical protein DFR79_13230 [Halanaerobium saccharolyticum]